MSNGFSDLGLLPELSAALEKENITQPTAVQARVIPLLLKKQSLLIQSETGTGKTLAYLLPLFQTLRPEAVNQAIILTPTHELAIQTQRQSERLTANSGLIIASQPVIGGANPERQAEKLKSKPQIIVGSSGRILEFVQRKRISGATIEMVILDEADRLLDDSNRDGVLELLHALPRHVRLLFLSASMAGKAREAALELSPHAEIVTTTEKPGIPDTIEHIYIEAEQRDKIEVMRKLLNGIKPARALVFVNQSVQIDNVTAKLKYHGYNVDSIHGTNTKLDRKAVLDNFKAGRIKLLVASEMAARGLHFEGVTHVFNLDMPEHSRGYLHRAGRTGRVGAKGTCISLVTVPELENLKKYSRQFGIEIKPMVMKSGELQGAPDKDQKNQQAGKL